MATIPPAPSSTRASDPRLTWSSHSPPRPATPERLDVVAGAPTSSPAAEAVRPVDVLATPGALDNVFRTLQTLPGVVAARAGTRQPSRRPRRNSRPEPDDDGRRGRSTESVSALRAGKRLQPGDNPQVRAGHRWLQREVWRPARQPPGGREPRRTRRAHRRHGCAERDRRQRRAGRGTARPHSRILARDGAADVYDLVAERFVDQGLPGFQIYRPADSGCPPTAHVSRCSDCGVVRPPA